MVERLSLADGSLFSSYAEDIQRHTFALDKVRGKCVLDAGCGTGFGSHFLAANGAKEVLAMDISEEAMTEARENYKRDNLRYERGDVEMICKKTGDFDVVTNFGSLPHLSRPMAFVEGAKSVLISGGMLIATMPNGETFPVDSTGKPRYRHQHRTFTARDLNLLLNPHFSQVSIFGQWLTHAGALRKFRDREIFEQLSEIYHNPMARIGRAINVLRGKPVKPAPVYNGEADSFAGDYAIHPFETRPFPWEASSLIVVAQL
jgi:2-polyprenyl-3-methyl-5-hydroxy-6-metoxy-1,4-benzoquinol methylase